MQQRIHIEELRDKMKLLKSDAQFLYQYGGLLSSPQFFNGLPTDDQRRFLAMAFLYGDHDMKRVAEVLLGKATDMPHDPRELLAQLPVQDREEIDACFQNGGSCGVVNEGRVRAEVDRAAHALGHLSFEEAVWILVPMSEDSPSTWVEAVGLKNDPLSSRVRLPSQVIYDPDEQMKHDLFTLMRRAACVLHVHNHPHHPGMITVPGASDQDLGFLIQWQSARPELKHKMRFFIVEGNQVTEYCDGKAIHRQWHAKKPSE